MAPQTVQVAEQIPRRRTRLPFIDFVRGIVMALVAWDHASDFWNEVPGGELLGGGASFLSLFRDAQGVPVRCPEMLGQEDDLSHVHCVVP